MQSGGYHIYLEVLFARPDESVLTGETDPTYLIEWIMTRNILRNYHFAFNSLTGIFVLVNFMYRYFKVVDTVGWHGQTKFVHATTQVSKKKSLKDSLPSRSDLICVNSSLLFQPTGISQIC